LDEINKTLDFLEPSIESEKDLTSKIIEPLHNFIEAHCNMSNYVFQVKKCQNGSCLHCSHHPECMSTENFEALCYLPLSLLDSKNESYLPFSEMYGQKPSEKDQPSKGSHSFQEVKELNTRRKPLFYLIICNVRDTITCRECYLFTSVRKNLKF